MNHYIAEIGPRAERPILITSFQPWRAHQHSNSSDDVIGNLDAQRQLPDDAIWLRRVPVSFQLAPMRVINAIYYWRPRAVICCGMAERRVRVTVEKRAKRLGGKSLETKLPLAEILHGTAFSEVSLDAGSYVCNHLYYSVLEFVEKLKMPTEAVFIHVPVLNLANQKVIFQDVDEIIYSISNWTIKSNKKRIF